MSFLVRTIVTTAKAAERDEVSASLKKVRGAPASLSLVIRPAFIERVGWVDGTVLEVAFGKDEHHGLLRLRENTAGGARLKAMEAGRGKKGRYFRIGIGRCPEFVDRSESAKACLVEILDGDDAGWIEIVLPRWADETSPNKAGQADRRPSIATAPVAGGRPSAVRDIAPRLMGDPPPNRSALAQRASEPTRGQARRQAEARETQSNVVAEAAEWNRKAADDNVLADLMGAFALTSSEARLVRTLADGKLKSREALHLATYGDDPQGGPEIKIIDVFIVKIRKKLQVRGVQISTVRGEGYRIEAPALARLRQVLDAQPSRDDDEAELAAMAREASS